MTPRLFDAEPRPQHRDPIYLQPRNRRRVETIEPAFLSARISDGDTATAAAKSITPGATEAAIEAVFDLNRTVDFTDDELCAALGSRYYKPTVVSARSRLAKAGLLEDSGERRLSVRGRQAIVWRLAS